MKKIIEFKQDKKMIHVTMEILKDEAKSGNNKAQFLLGEVYRTGNDVIPQNYKKAVKYYGLAAEQGNSDAKYHLELLRQKKECFKHDSEKGKDNISIKLQLPPDRD